MVKQISLLCRLQSCNLFGLNEFRFTRDKAKKRNYLLKAFVVGIVIVLLLFYVTAFSIGMGMLGMAEIIPIYLYTIVSLITLFLSFFKAGSVLFSLKSYEMLVSLPFSKAAIIVSRFFEMYMTTLMAGVLVMLPGIIVYGIYEKPGVSFYPVSLLAVIFLPMLPLTIASVLGAVIKAISSRSKHKSIGETVLMVVVIVAVLLGSFTSSTQLQQMDQDAIRNLMAMMSEQIGATYPPAELFQNAICGDVVSLLILVAFPTLVFVIFAAVLQKYFQRICMALNASLAKNNYKMETLSTNSVIIALWKKEWKRYMASSAYVTNTIVGYILALLFAIMIWAVGIEKMENTLGMSVIWGRVIPFLLATVLSIMPITSCSISMEGKNYWMLQTLPIEPKDVYRAKMLLNFTVGAPFTLLATVISCIAIKASVMEALWIVIIPMGYLCFTIVMGIAVNLKLPVLNWDNEMCVVKQSSATLITMFVGIISGVIPFVAVILLQGVNTNVFMAVVTAVLLLVTGILYQRVLKRDLP